MYFFIDLLNQQQYNKFKNLSKLKLNVLFLNKFQCIGQCTVLACSWIVIVLDSEIYEFNRQFWILEGINYFFV